MSRGLVCLSCGRDGVTRRYNHGRQWYEAFCLCGAKEESVHGRHWKAFAAAGSGAADRARGSAGADEDADSESDTIYYTSPPAGKGGLNYLNLYYGGTFNQPKIIKSQSAKWPLSGFVPFGIYPVEPEKPKLDQCAPEVGEIVAYRTWRYAGGYLQSMAADVVWMPGKPMVGDVDKGHEIIGMFMNVIADGGVHAWKDFQDAVTYAAQYLTFYNRDDGAVHKREIVIGKVALYGNVVEHEKGYRADKAKVHAIDDVLCDPEFPKLKAMTILREFYGLNEVRGG